MILGDVQLWKLYLKPAPGETYLFWYVKMHDVMKFTTYKRYRVCHVILYTEQNYQRNTFVFAPIFHELNSKI